MSTVIRIYWFSQLLLSFFSPHKRTHTHKEREMEDEGSECQQELKIRVESLYRKCELIKEDCIRWNETKPIEGLYRYLHSLDSETNFLKKLLENQGSLKKEQIQSTNLNYLEAVYEALYPIKRITEVMHLFSIPPDNNVWMAGADMLKNNSAKVDIVAEKGLVWIKVIARNAKALRHELFGLEWEDDSDESETEEEQAETVFDNLAIFKKAREYLKCAKMHHVHYRVPIVVFAFMRIRKNEDMFVQRIMDRLAEIGIAVYLQDDMHPLPSAYEPLLKHIDMNDITTKSLNLDVSTVLALISELSHCPCPPDQLTSPPLVLQAEREIESAALPGLRKSLENKKLFMVQSAFNKLKEIVEVVGGPHEIARFHYLFRKHLGLNLEFDPKLWTILPSMSVNVLEDARSERFFQLLMPPPRKSKLNNGRKIRTRFSEFHAIVFGSGDAYKMTTITTIQWMETSLMDAGITGHFIICHEPRSLAENKMHKGNTLGEQESG
ncbi:hypothetical protein BDB01DRAFT_794182 [Pilobolus umbonatus]|nr:hypothetical protein BDB01DRAFT_794182 [Pilobolus umbonatus]